MNSAIIVAGGIGKRAETTPPKQFIHIYDKNRIIDYSINLLKSNDYINEIIIVVCEGWENIILDENPNCKVIIGGSSRTESVFLGLKACSNQIKNVIIHDAARPFITNEFINSIFISLFKFDAVIPALSNSDSIIKITDKSLEYINRDNIKFVQTPQGFDYKIILAAYIKNNNRFTYPDDMSLLLSSNKDINYSILDALDSNFKITSNYDIKKAKEKLTK